MMNYACKVLEASDLNLMLGLLPVFGQAFAEPDTYQSRIPRESYLTALLNSNNFIAIAALDQADNVLGGLAAYVLQKFEQERSEVYLYDLAVSEDYRRQGIATALVHQLKQAARELGAYVIFVQADRGDDEAIQFYESISSERIDVHHFDIRV
jgi:aminoglycoside 3-N-acetyltransferase I